MSQVEMLGIGIGEGMGQRGLFDDDPVLTNFGVTGSKLKGSQLSLTIECVTNVNDLGMLNEGAWVNGVAEWLILICSGRVGLATHAVEQAKERLVGDNEK